jgi:hypothetical protein
LLTSGSSAVDWSFFNLYNLTTLVRAQAVFGCSLPCREVVVVDRVDAITHVTSVFVVSISSGEQCDHVTI